MLNVRVIAAMGATVRGPAKLGLSKAQHSPRESILGPWKRGGVFTLSGSESVTFKYGEEFGMSEPSGRLNRALFEFEEDPAQAAELDLGGGGKSAADDKKDGVEQ